MKLKKSFTVKVPKPKLPKSTAKVKLGKGYSTHKLFHF